MLQKSRKKILWLVSISYPDLPRPKERESVHACIFYDNDNKKINIPFICHIAEFTAIN